jgi:hypothetical protein
MMQAYDELVETLLRKAENEKKIFEVPEAPRERVEKVRELYPDDETIEDNMDLYVLLRKIYRSKHEREREYRRHVTLRTFIDGREEIVNIDIAEEYYNFLKEFYDYVEDIVTEE